MLLLLLVYGLTFVGLLCFLFFLFVTFNDNRAVHLVDKFHFETFGVQDYDSISFIEHQLSCTELSAHLRPVCIYNSADELFLFLAAFDHDLL